MQKLNTVSRDNPPVPVRHMDFGFDDKSLQRYFYDNNAFASAFYMAFSSVIPQGERFFIHSVRHYREQINDPELEARVTGFIGQEAMHGKEHDAVNAAYEQMGFPLGRIDRNVRDALRWLSKKLPKPAQLAFTVALEHYTAIISEYMLTHPEVRAKFEPTVGNFIFWHMMEETEHKAVAFDVWEAVMGRGPRAYAIRALGLALATVIFWGLVIPAFVQVLRNEGKLTDVKGWQQFYRYTFGEVGLLRMQIRAYLDYYRPSFHPWDHDNSEYLKQIDAFLAEQEKLAAA